METKTFKQKLEAIKETTSSRLKEAVIDSVLNYYEDDEEINGYFEDLQRGGCQSGMVSELIYYKDTNDFFDEHEDEIEDLITSNMDMLGTETRPLFIESLNGTAESITQEKNLLSWFAYEETAREIYEEITIEND